MSEWQDIESAPVGVPVLIYDAERYVAKARDPLLPPIMVGVGVVRPAYGGSETIEWITDVWREEATENSNGELVPVWSPVFIAPSHWMPLPAPPNPVGDGV